MWIDTLAIERRYEKARRRDDAPPGVASSISRK